MNAPEGNMKGRCRGVGEGKARGEKQKPRGDRRCQDERPLYPSCAPEPRQLVRAGGSCAAWHSVRTSSCWRFAAASDPIKNSHCQKNKEVGNQPQNVLRTSFLPFPARDLITALVDGAAASGRVARAACNIEPRLTVTRAGLRRWLKITTEAAEQPRQEDDCNALCPDFRGEDESVLKVSRGNQGIR